jgi:hypothetical protein
VVAVLAVVELHLVVAAAAELAHIVALVQRLEVLILGVVLAVHK